MISSPASWSTVTDRILHDSPWEFAVAGDAAIVNEISAAENSPRNTKFGADPGRRNAIITNLP
jgi:hypothetical protein